MTSDSVEWETPPDFYALLDKTFHFTLDPCCREDTALCATFFTMKEDGLAQSWEGHTVFMNPPYGRLLTATWVEKAYREALHHGTVVVALIPARTDTVWWHEYVMHAREVRLVRGRLKFYSGGLPQAAGATFPSAVVIFDGYHAVPHFSTMERA